MTETKATQTAHRALQKIMEEQAVKAARSEYDISVCISAVSAARRTFEGIEVKGSAPEYVAQVYDAISDLQNGYNDSDGQYTNGRASIGDVLGRVYQLQKEIEG